MRAFFGVPIPASEPLRALVEELRSSTADLKVVAPDRFHLTMKFLGEVPPEVAKASADNARLVALPKPFDLRLHDVGAFPNWKHPNTLWVHVEDATSGLLQVRSAIEQGAAGAGIPPEDRPFTPHLTIARKRSDKNLAAARDVMNRHRQQDFGPVHVERVNLYKSTLGPQGPTYEVVETIPL